MPETKSGDVLPAWRRWLPRAGALGALFTTACCIGLPAVVSLLSAVGAGVLLNDRYLQPLLVATLLITISASALTYWRHRNPMPLIVTTLSAALIYWFIYRDYRVPIVWVGAAALVGAQVWEVVAVRSCTPRARRRAGPLGVAPTKR
jgi:uncharacterized membrane protein (UPF0136 family)